ncbi:TPA: hypothetical protein ACJG67_002805 [Salmonella enterica subsp. enterica serovar Kottbus]
MSGLASRIETATDTRRERVFYCRMHAHTKIMVGCVGASKDAPVRFPGYANPAQFTTQRLASQVVGSIETIGGRRNDKLTP